MALTRKMLKGMGLTEEQADTIIEAHTEVTDGLKDRLKEAEGKLASLVDVQKELDELKQRGGTDYEAKYKEAKKALEDYKAEVTAKETKAAREAAAKAFFEAQHITGANLAIAMRGARDEIAELQLDTDGKIKDGSKLENLVKNEFASLVVKSSTRGASTTTPPTTTGGSGKMTKEQIMAIKDIGQRQAAIAENHELFGF